MPGRMDHRAGSRTAPIKAMAGGVAWFLCVLPAFAQAPVHGSGGNIRIVNTDMAVLEMQEVRNDLPCAVTPRKPVLGFDLRFHAGYDVDVPLKDLSGSENELTILFRVTAASHKDDPTYFVQ